MTMGAKREEITSAHARNATPRGLPASEDALRCLVLIALIVGFAFATRGATISGANIANVLLQSAITGISACGQALVVTLRAIPRRAARSRDSRSGLEILCQTG
jgi:ABC-type xylose transport system permease subunit